MPFFKWRGPSCDIQCCHAACLLCFDAHPCIGPRMCNYCWHTLLWVWYFYSGTKSLGTNLNHCRYLTAWTDDLVVIKLLDMMICYNQSRRSVLQLPLARLGMDSAIIMAGTSYLELQIISIYIHMAVYNMLFRFQNKCCSFSIRTKTTTLIFNG